MALIDDHHTMLQLVKIVEEFPDIYDHNTDSYRRWCANKAWDTVAERVKAEMNIACTVEELKSKWKGIRSSFNRYKSKLIQSRNDRNPPKKYYLYDALRFLDPFTKPKNIPQNSDMNEANASFEESFDNAVEDTALCPSEEDNDNHSEWSEIDVKPDLLKRNKDESQSSDSEEDKLAHISKSKKAKKRRHFKNDVDAIADNEDLQFFRSILPDIVDFTSKEKRRLKISILKLIDDIEKERK